MSRNSRKEIMRTNFEREIQLLMSTTLKFKYNGHHVMSRVFKYRYHANICKIEKVQICRWYHHRGTITDITKTVRQVKKILNLIFWEIF